MRYWLGLAFILILAVSISGCPSKNSPSAAAPPADTSTPTITPTPLSVRWSGATVSKLNDLGTVSQYLQLEISVGGQAVTNIPVVFTGGNISAPITLTYNSSTTLSGIPYAVYYQNGSGWTYQAGQNYSLTAYTAGGASAATLTAPGGITIAANGSSVSWVNGGNLDYVAVTSGGVTTFSSPSAGTLASPYSIPATAYANPGTYNISVAIFNELYSVPGIVSGTFNVNETDVQSLTVAAPTATPSSTPTKTPTLTPSSTPTPTPSGTATILPTNTPTITATFTPSSTPTLTATYTISSTPTATATNSPTVTITMTPTNTPTGPHWRYAGAEGFLTGGFAHLALSGSTVYWQDVDNTTNYPTITSWTGSAWNPVNSDSSVYAGLSSFFVDNGTPYVAFGDDSNSNYATLMKYSAGSWSYVGSAGFSPWAIDDISLYVYDNGTTVIPYVAFNNLTSATYQTTVMAYASGTNSWVTVGAPDFSAGSVDTENLVVDSSGTPYLAYRDSSTSPSSIKVMKYTASGATSWTAVGSNPIPSLQYPSLAIASGTLYLAFQDKSTSPVGQPSVMTSSGVTGTAGNWSYLGPAGGAATTAQALYLSLFTDGTTTYVAFSDNNDVSERLTVEKYSGGTWSLVGNAHFTPAAATYPSLAVQGGIPYVSFQDYNSQTSGYYNDTVMYYQ